MKHLAWLTDIHLNFVRPASLEAFFRTLSETHANAFIISGDIAEADDVFVRLNEIAERVEHRFSSFLAIMTSIGVRYPGCGGPEAMHGREQPVLVTGGRRGVAD